MSLGNNFRRALREEILWSGCAVLQRCIWWWWNFQLKGPRGPELGQGGSTLVNCRVSQIWKQRISSCGSRHGRATYLWPCLLFPRVHTCSFCMLLSASPSCWDTCVGPASRRMLGLCWFESPSSQGHEPGVLSLQITQLHIFFYNNTPQTRQWGNQTGAATNKLGYISEQTIAVGNPGSLRC